MRMKLDERSHLDFMLSNPGAGMSAARSTRSQAIGVLAAFLEGRCGPGASVDAACRALRLRPEYVARAREEGLTPRKLTLHLAVARNSCRF